MKPLLTLLILVGFLTSNAPAAIPRAQGKRIDELNLISTRVLQRSISPWFFKSLCVSPIQGWVVVRANIVDTHFSGPRIIHSELDGAYDELALKLAKEQSIRANYSLERPGLGHSVLLHLLVYQIADGTMVLTFPTFDDPGGNQMRYWGCAKLLVLKNDGKWTEIEGPEGLQGKGWEVRQACRWQTITGFPIKN
jgi:hypothetical protein